tara:strand:+ start:392 stop:1045 length:654 start_codon:yes stop_codon:yes gene_type:complete
VKNKIFNEDCLDTIKRDLQYDYCFFSPPDYDELSMTPIKDDDEYYEWMRDIYSNLNPRKNVVTIVVSNRRYNRKTIPKHEYITSIMKDLGYDLLNEKIWEKSREINMYRYNYAFVLCYGKGNIKSKNTKRFKYDIWFHPFESYKKYSYNFSKDMVVRCIENYTEVGDVVYDPFIGVGTTALACLETERNYLGSEIDSKVYKICMSRLEQYQRSTKWF